MFLLKKIVGPFFFPLFLCLEILIVGVILLWFTRKKRAGRIIVSVGVGLLVLFSYGGVPDMLLRPLEYKFPPLLESKDIPNVKWIVVLGGGHTSDPRIPIGSQLWSSSLFRLVEGIRLHRSLPGSKLILSGGALFDPIPEAEVLAKVAMSLGVDREKLVLESVAKDTEQEARLIQKIVRKDPFILVTSASHMPRSVALFRKLGMQPIPAPTDYLVKERQGEDISPGMFFPGIEELQKAEAAIYEYLGLAWAKLRGRI